MFKFLGQFVYQWVDVFSLQLQTKDDLVRTTGLRSRPPMLKRVTVRQAFKGAMRNLRAQKFYDDSHTREILWKRKAA